MIVCETILMMIIVTLGIYVTYTDIKRGIIRNRALVISAILSATVNTVYFVFFVRDFFLLYIINLLAISLVAIALYGFKFWAAGDSKLLIVVTSLFPARLYDNDGLSFVPGVHAFIVIFLVAYVYIIFETIILFFKKEKFYGNTKFIGIKSFLLSYLVCFIYLNALSSIFRHVLGKIYYANVLIFSLFNIFLAIVILDKKIFRKWYLLLAAIGVIVFFIKDYSFTRSYLYGYCILLVALFLRHILNGYNYKTIEVSEINKGDVLSYSSILLFEKSRIKGLPKSTTEDISSRISEEEADAIKRWGKSKNGETSITVVRKIPFAIFIIVGELLYFALRVL